MSSKRKHDENVNSQNVHESRQFQVHGNVLKSSKKRRIQEKPSFIKSSSPSSINAIKKKLRDVNRRLALSKTISADMRVEDERARDAYQTELAVAEAEKTRQRMVKRYHMVRFFERQKASRLIKKIRRSILVAASTDLVQSLKQKLHEAEVDLNYALYHPLSENYISLYPRKKAPGEEHNKNLDIFTKKPPIWYEIEEAMVNGSLDKIRNRTSLKQISTPKLPNVRNTKNQALQHPKNNTGLKLVQLPNDGLRKQTGGKMNMASAMSGSPNTQHSPNEKDEDSDGEFFE